MICNPRRRNARVQKHNGSARTRFAPSKNFFDQKSLKYYVNGGLGVSIMGDLDEAQRSRSPPRGHPKRLFGDFWAIPKVTRPQAEFLLTNSNLLRNKNIPKTIRFWGCFSSIVVAVPMEHILGDLDEPLGKVGDISVSPVAHHQPTHSGGVGQGEQVQIIG